MALLMVGVLVCAVQAIRAAGPLIAALWLAGASALMATLLYGLGAREVAVIELSVGAGLVIVLLVFAIHLAGEEAEAARKLVPLPLAGGLIALALILLGGLVLPLTVARPASGDTSFTYVLWQDRSLDALLQVMLIFTGALSILGLLVEKAQTKEAGQTLAGKLDNLPIPSEQPNGNGREAISENSSPEEVHG